ncbi:MAG: hypothetical protein ACJATI_003373 [Halioglobus sp.]|jgi:hypothetical protein
MSKKYKYISLPKIMMVFIILACTIGLSPLNAQKILITESGQKILISADGSWSIVKYDETIDSDGNIVSETSTSLEAFQAPSAGKYPLTVEQKATVKNMLKALLSDEAQLLVNREFFKDNIDILKEKKKIAKEIKDKHEEDSLTKRIKLTKASVKKNNEAYKNSSKLVADTNELLEGKVKNIEEHIARLIQTTESPQQADSGMGGVIEEKDSNNNNEELKYQDRIEEEIQILNDKKIVTNYPKSFIVEKKKFPRDKYECKITFDGYDEIMRSNKKEVKSDFFFGHSQKKMKPYFKSDDFIKCDAHVSKIGKKHYITLNIRVKSKNAKKTYGMIRANETIRFEMVDGSKVYCTSMIQDGGTIEPYTGNTLYTGIFEIEKDDLGTLKNNFLDNIGIIWSSGYEQYNIFNVDFLKNQLQCLKK